ncbi:MAG: hypothetical protein M0Z87_05345 [Actinomycetota bacterium]|nr:hypothetical protein [Actinomycetota bacterium]
MVGRAIDGSDRQRTAQALSKVRREVSRRSSAATDTSPEVLDVDASLVGVHSENASPGAAS